MALKAKSKLVDGVRVDVNTGEALAPSTGRQQNNLISLNKLNSTETPAKVPSVATPTSTLGSDISTQANVYQKQLDSQAEKSTNAEETMFDTLLKSTLEAPTQEGLEDKAYKNEGVDTLQSELTAINQQILEEEESTRKKVEAIQTQAGTATKAERDLEVAEINRGSLRRKADLSVIQLAKQGRYTDAKAVADRAVSAEMAVEQRKLDVLGLAYERSKYLFDKDEQRAFESAQADRERALNMEEFKLKSEYEQKIKQNDPLYLAQLAQARFDLSSDVDASVAPVNAMDSVGQLDFLLNTATTAKDLANESGQGAITRGIGDIVGGSKYRQLETYTDTLKTNMLTLATDPSIKKFFGPQMSNADVLLMTSAGTTLRPSSQSPAQMRAEIKRIEDFLTRAKNAVSQGAQQEQAANSGLGQTITAPDGTRIFITD